MPRPRDSGNLCEESGVIMDDRWTEIAAFSAWGLQLVQGFWSALVSRSMWPKYANILGYNQ